MHLLCQNIKQPVNCYCGDFSDNAMTTKSLHFPIENNEEFQKVDFYK